jgi:hypothetical protein
MRKSVGGVMRFSRMCGRKVSGDASCVVGCGCVAWRYDDACIYLVADA